MRHTSALQFQEALAADPVDVSIVMPCLNEAQCLAICIANAREALDLIRERYGLDGEIVVADNGSTDGSQAIAAANGARVAPVAERGYGAALIGGGFAARGRYVVFGDADGSYDFRESVAMVGKLIEGADLCMGSRFKGGIAPGAMPWKNRYIGNPALTGILKLFFRPGISDAHCGLRALTRDAFEQLRLNSSGMEFASEMVIKAALLKLAIAEVPATLSPDLRDREPHLRPWRDGWRHLRYLLMLSPTWLFAVPALASILLGMGIFGASFVDWLALPGRPTFGTSWTIVAGALLGIGHIGALLAIATHLYGVRAGYRRLNSSVRLCARMMTLEAMLISGLALALVGGGLVVAVAYAWSQGGYRELESVLPLVAGTTLGVIGLQNVLGGFMLAIIAGNEADFLKPILASSTKVADGETRYARAA